MKKQLSLLSIAILSGSSLAAESVQLKNELKGNAATGYAFSRANLDLKKARVAPVIDGLFSENEWQDAVQITDFVVFRPTLGDKPTYPVTAYLSYDENFLYVAAEIHQPQNTITDRVLTQGSDLWNEDYFGITLDTNYDKRDAYLFHVSPSGVKEDGLVDGTDYIGQWSTLWYAKTTVFDDGWRVEMAIPMQSISFEKKIETWGIQLRHKLSSPYQQVYWNLNDGEANGWTAGQVAPISGLQGLEQGIGVELRPGLAYKSNDDESEWVPSLDAFYKITPSLTGVVTVNTDFSGTEVDEVDMNMSRFAQYFDEKRDFFLQDSQVFNFGGINDGYPNAMAFYSRRIGQGKSDGILDINWGTKLTGQIGDTRVGVLSVNQQRDGDKDETTQLSVARVSQQVAEHHQVGLITTQGSADNRDNSGLWGVDYRYENSIFNEQRIEGYGWYQETEKQHEDEDTKAYGIQLYLPNDAVYFRAKYRYVGDDFDPALGFVNRKGVQYYEFVNHLRYRPTDGWLADHINYFQTNVFYWQTDDTNNERLSQEYRLRPFQVEFKDSSFFYIQHETRKENLKTPFKMGRNITFNNDEFKFSRWYAYFRSDSSKPIYGNVRVSRGEFYDSDMKHLEFTLNYKPNKHFSFELSRQNYYYQRESQRENMFGTRFKMDVAFDSDWSWNTLLQHNTQSDTLSVFTRLRYQSKPDELYQLTLSQGYDMEDGWHERVKTADETALKLNYIFRW
ncbi:carbohydrate binding family 9 domain-containing protein [Pseudoalteromonas xiamenensis]